MHICSSVLHWSASIPLRPGLGHFFKTVLGFDAPFLSLLLVAVYIGRRWSVVPCPLVSVVGQIKWHVAIARALLPHEIRMEATAARTSFSLLYRVRVMPCSLLFFEDACRCRAMVFSLSGWWCCGCGCMARTGIRPLKGRGSSGSRIELSRPFNDSDNDVNNKGLLCNFFIKK